MLERLAPDGRLIVSELSRLGRRLGQVVHNVDELVKRKMSFTAIKESIPFEGKAGLADQVMVTLFGLSAEVERDLTSQRTLAGLDGQEEEIRLVLAKAGLKRPPFAKIVGVTRPTIHRFIKTRRLRPHP